jgi:hypothetical protein
MRLVGRPIRLFHGRSQDEKDGLFGSFIPSQFVLIAAIASPRLDLISGPDLAVLSYTRELQISADFLFIDHLILKVVSSDHNARSFLNSAPDFV